MYLMRKFLFIILLLASGYSPADNTRQIELIDGSFISGEVISLADGIYTIQSTSLGTLEIDEAKIVSIHLQVKPEKLSTDNSEIKANPQFRFAKDPTSHETDAVPTLQALQGLLLGDKEMMGMILALQNDPAIQEILSNPATMEAVNSGDLSTLLSDPTFLKLLEEPQIQTIQKKLSQ